MTHRNTTPVAVTEHRILMLCRAEPMTTAEIAQALDRGLERTRTKVVALYADGRLKRAMMTDGEHRRTWVYWAPNRRTA